VASTLIFIHSLSLQRWHGQLSAVIAALQAAAGVQVKPSGTAVTEARQQGSDRESVASGAARSSFADGRDMLGGEGVSGAVHYVVLGLVPASSCNRRHVLLVQGICTCQMPAAGRVRRWRGRGGFLQAAASCSSGAAVLQGLQTCQMPATHGEYS
jgi:hypothetical protein